MGICLDTDQQDGSQVFEEAGAQNAERWRREAGILATPPGGNFPMRNSGPVRFEPPVVPVIFVLGGPGSGKVTHCDNLAHEKKGIVHINMTDLLQQYALGNEMQDFGLLSSKTVTEVLMLEMKMSPGAKTFLVSGYPRNMRDVVEYSDKIQIVNGVILVAWKQEVLERQIEYGAQLGQVIIELARMELRNFYKNVMPVAEYFDQGEMLVVVNGERNPSEVYVDFRESFLRILGMTDDAAGSSSSPQRQVSSSMEAEVEVVRPQELDETITREVGRLTVPNNSPPTTPPPPTPPTAPTQLSPTNSPLPPPPPAVAAKPQPPVIGDEILPLKTADVPRKGLPPIVWVLGGPGSNKSIVCAQAVRKRSNWVHISIGSLLVTLAARNSQIHEALATGEMAPTEVVMLLVEKHILLNRDSMGIVLDGFPRDLTQAREFENKFGQRPEMLLLDVSRLQEDRGRLYDGARAFERRLQIFREISLPMLKNLDSDGRLNIVEGDTDIPDHRQRFVRALVSLMRRASGEDTDFNNIIPYEDDELDDLEDDADIVSRVVKSNAPNGGQKIVANGVGHRGNNEAVVGNGAAGGRKLQANGGPPNMRTAARKVIANNRLQQQQNGQRQGQQSKRSSASTTSSSITPTTKTPRSQQQQQPMRNHQQVNGGVHLLQNGVPPRMGNGFLPSNRNNKITPLTTGTRQNGVTTIQVDPARRPVSEVESNLDYPPTNLHM